MSSLQFVSFADGAWEIRRSGQRLSQQAVSSGFFSKVSIFSSEELSPYAPSSVTSLWSKGNRGFGYWTWKPWAVLRALDEMPKNSMGIWYADAGCTISRSREASLSLKRYLGLTRGDSWGLGFQLSEDFSELRYTKPEVLRFMAANTEDMSAGQVQATCFFIRNSDAGRQLVESWARLTLEPWLFDDARVGLDSSKEHFLDHRHDQSIFSLLTKQTEGTLIPDELHKFQNSKFGDSLETHSPVPFNATRLRSGFNSVSMSMPSRMLRLAEKLIGKVLS